MRHIFTCFLTFLLFLNAWSEQFDRKLNWTNGDRYFDGCTVLDRLGIPYYIENVSVPDQSVRVVIQNAIFETLADSLIAFRDSIPAELKYKTEAGFSDGRCILRLTVCPFIRKDNHIEKLVAFSYALSSDGLHLKSASTGYNWKSKSVLASGKWIKISVKDKGVFKITYDQLKQWGFSNPDQVAMYGNGGYMLPVLNKDIAFDDLNAYPVLKGKDGAGKDCLFFYSTGNIRITEDAKTGLLSHKQNYYSTETYFYLTDQGNIKTIDKTAEISATADRQVSAFNNYTYYEKEGVNLLSSGSRWFGEIFNPGQSQTFSITLDNPDLTKPVQVAISAAGRSSSASTMNVTVNSNSKDNIVFYPVDVNNPTEYYAADLTSTFSDQLNSKSVQVKLTYQAGNNTSNAWLDYISVNYTALLSMSSDVFYFRGKGAEGTYKVSEFVLNGTSSNTKIVDVTDFNNSFEVPSTLSGGQSKIKSNATTTREYVAFNTNGSISSPELVGTVSNQNLHGNSSPEMIIVSTSSLISVANSIAELHRENDNMTVEVVTPDLVYNEFSGGLPDPSGLRNYFRMYYDRGAQSGTGGSLKYVLLLGKGSYDNRNILGKNHNLLPTYQADESLLPTESFVTDDFFAFLDEGEGGSQGIVDLGIGRIPAENLTDAKAVVAKILNYYKPVSIGNWRNVVTFIADDGNMADEYTNIHTEQADNLAQFVNSNYPAFYTDKIYFDSFKRIVSSGGEKYPDVNQAIQNRLKQGTLVMNYTGHANARVLADEDVLDIASIKSLSNYNRLPIFVTATCEFSRFDADEPSAGETILFHAQGGGIGLFSTTRTVYSGANFELNRKFFDYIFEKDNQGNNLRLGDIMRKAKAAANTGTNQLSFTLLADPAIRPANPGYQVKTSSINGKDASTQTENISPLSVVTVKGYIADANGAKISSYNGEVIPSVYDKAQIVETLGNAGQTPMSYKVQTNLIYKGLATVKDGEFEFSFVVPKDVAFKLDKGKILYYAYNETTDAKGYFDGFYIGGAPERTITDNKGPEIEPFLNTTSFKDGDQVGASSVLIANVTDETGINTSGIGIGHDITAVLDGDYSNIMVLNDYFQSDKDDYNSGKIVYPLSDLSEGEHTLTLKVWDVLNNSSEVEIHFVVKDDFRIESASCYPNPMQGQTKFVFRHNYPDESFTVKVDVFQITGSLIDSFTTTVGSSGTESLPIDWVPSDRNIRMRAGVYLFRLTATTSKGIVADGSGRLVFVYP